MITRQRLLLYMLHCAGGEASRLQLVKWAFLLSRESRTQDVATFYQFVPYRFGPFSFTLYHELESLISQGLLRACSLHQLTLTPCGRAEGTALSAELRWGVEAIWRHYGRMSAGELMNLVYERHPWYTLNSTLPGRRATGRPHAPSAIYTIGYEGLQVDGFLDMLLRAGIDSLVDVRSNPVSRRYGFHRGTLASLCAHLEISYRHLPKLGVPSSWRSGLHLADDYRELFRRYENEVLRAADDLLCSLGEQMARSATVLLCQEADPERCHRSCLARSMARRTGLPVLDLRGNDVHHL